MNHNIQLTPEQVHNLNILSSFLGKWDIGQLSSSELNCHFGIKKADMLILLGNGIPYIAEVAAEAFKNGISHEFMIVGGIGHSTKYLMENIMSHERYNTIEVFDRAEADILCDVAVQHAGIDRNCIIIENKSTNCGSNAHEALRVIREYELHPKSIILMQDPTMQLRTNASFVYEWREEKGVTFINYSAFVPQITYLEQGLKYQHGLDKISGLWSLDRFVSLVMGEIPRLMDNENGYGPKGKGFISHVDIPENVLAAYDCLSKDFSNLTKLRNLKEGL